MRVLPMITAALLLAAPALADDEEFGALYVDEGVDDTYYTCVACHSERIIVQQGLSRDAWDRLIDWMIDEQGMAEIDDELRTSILDYLTANYNVDRPHFPGR